MRFRIVAVVIAVGVCQTKPRNDLSDLGPEIFDNPAVSNDHCNLV